MFGDLGKLMKIAGRMKARVCEMRERLANSDFTAESGGGVVKATVNSKMALVGLKIDRSVLTDDRMDTEMLEDLIKAAVSAAQQEAASAAAEGMKELTGGVDIPELDEMMGL